MKLVVQFFNEKDGTRSDALSGTPSDLLDAISQIEESLVAEEQRCSKVISEFDTQSLEPMAPMLDEYQIAKDALDRFVDSFVIVILEQHSDDPEDMRVSRIPILKREHFINVLKEKAQ